MLAPESAESTSNWDFTPVFELLRSPTYGGASPPVTIRPESAGPSLFSDGQSKRDKATNVKPQRSYTKLGDFGSLWDLLDQVSGPVKGAVIGASPETKPGDAHPILHPPALTIPEQSSSGGSPGAKFLVRASSHNDSRTIPVSNASKPRVSKGDVAEGSSRPSAQPQAITVLKRSSDNRPTGNDATVESLPPTPPKAIPCSGNSIDTPLAKTKPRAGATAVQIKSNNGTTSSESSAEAESDSNTIVFDPPLPKKSGGLAFVPPQVGTPDARSNHYDTPPSSYDELDSALNSDTIAELSTSGSIRVRPTTYKSAAERRVGLMTKLLHDFPDYAKVASQVGRAVIPSKNDSDSRPVHVFVDMSNVMVGFHDSVKVSRGIPITTRIRRLHISFSNFSLIMERGRPIAKRVLVGSDRLPSINEAETLGYEANILDRVHKAKYSASRPSKSRKIPGLTSQLASGGPETVATSGERWVEQGVDEILHLKILESLLDTDEPATIVLATGDAAAAEYSGGFMRMVERALQRGWIVELVSFSQVTSYAYRKKEFRARWGDRFRMVELDSYIEELFE